MTRPRIGLIPAAGTGSRLGRLPLSKELLPVRLFGSASTGGSMECAIERAVSVLVDNDITRQYVVIRPGKWDIPSYLLDGSALGAQLAYLVAEASPSVPHSLDAAYPFASGAEVVVVFPDIVFKPRNAISRILDVRTTQGADVALALVPRSLPCVGIRGNAATAAGAHRHSVLRAVRRKIP